MNIQRATPVNELLARIIFLLLPTAVVGYYLLNYANAYYAILRNQALQQTLYLSAGMIASAVFYMFRFRFLPTFALLVFVLYLGYAGLDRSGSGEFDAFFIARAFQVSAILFSLGWLVGWGFLRVRYWSVLLAALLLSGCILVISRMKTDSVDELLRAFAPAVLYAVYIIFTAEQIYNYKDKSQKFWWFLSRRLALFGILAVLLLGSIIYAMQDEIKETVANHGGGGKEGENSMLQQDKNGHFDLKDYSRLSGSLGRNNELLFCAYIDNYFEGTDIPNPLYLTAFHYTKFDTLTETFERDSLIPKNDLFEPDPAAIPLFNTRTDSSVIGNSMGPQLRKTVEIQVYTRKLSPHTYLAPSTGYFVQPITVEKDFREEFKTAFRAKSYASELNSAYFVYNADDPQIQMFQEQRFEILRRAKDYDDVDSAFMAYYTDMPDDTKFNVISALADSITRDAKTAVDKVIAIRDYFLSKDENGDPLFRYSDNPGIPDIPSASKLMYFLFENRQGYCAYYAGATLFMLRALGIPSRITVGFLTVDRSDKNKGWYWYYADQAHAWVQVYFPGFGWLDFDTTVGNDDARESPQPDQTPPMQPPKAWLAAEGIVANVDTAKKILTLNVRRMVFHDKEYEVKPPSPISMDVHIAAIHKDSIEIPLSEVQKGDDATAVSYADAIRKMKPATNETGIALSKRLPAPAPIDEVYVKQKDLGPQEQKAAIEEKEQPVSLKQMAITALWIALAVIILIFLAPLLIYRYFLLRYTLAKPAGQKAYWAYRAATFWLHQSGMPRSHLTPMRYALTVVDPALGTNFGAFMNLYLKQKYAGQALSKDEGIQVAGFLKGFLSIARKHIPRKKRFTGFLSPLRAWNYFVGVEMES